MNNKNCTKSLLKPNITGIARILSLGDSGGQKYLKNCRFKLKFGIFLDFLSQSAILQYIDIKSVVNMYFSNTAYLLGFTHPTTQERMSFSVPLPQSFEDELNQLRKNKNE